MFIENKEMEKCNDPEHNPPMGYHYDKSGVWVCPSCGHITPVDVVKPMLKEDDIVHGDVSFPFVLPLIAKAVKAERLMDENFKDNMGKTYLVRCPKCGKENYAPSVSSGVCAWCGYDANKEEENE